jgi:hypothetical protein
MAFGRRRRARAQDREPAAEERGAKEERGTGTETREERATGEDKGAGVAVAGRRAVGSGLLLVAKLVMLVAVLIAAVIGLAILLKVLGANPSNSIVKGVHDVGKALVGSFKDIFEIKRPKVSIAVNWGLAAVVYLAVGAIISRIFRGLARRSHPDRRAT